MSILAHNKSAESSDVSLFEKPQSNEKLGGAPQDPVFVTATTDETQTSEPLDSGIRAWCQVLAGHLVLFNTSGYVLSFGIFQPYYVDTLNVETSTIAWVGSVQICLSFLVGAPAGRAFDAGHCKTILFIGSVLQVAGILSTSWGSKYWQIFLAQGLCQGLGCGIIFAPGVANVATWFSRRRSLAISMASCGANTGGLVFSFMARQLLPRIGFSWTVRAMGLVVLANSVMIYLLLKPRLPPQKSGPVVDMDAFRDRSYLLFAMSMFFTIWTAYFGYFYARQYAVKVLGANQSTSFNLLLVVSAVGYSGRLIPALIADRFFGPIKTFIPILFGMAICMFTWIEVKSIASYYVWIFAFGFFGAAIHTMFPSTLAFLTKKNLSMAGTRIGMIFTIVSVSGLTGPPLAGKLVEVCHGSYWGLQMWAGTSTMMGGLLLVATSLADRSSRVRPAAPNEV
ncbi:hypothetical protein E4U21_005270 [Claviceps maximensis]|nr:hypothetical protein E4U21_005270 [Claviceps maximensis]